MCSGEGLTPPVYTSNINCIQILFESRKEQKTLTVCVCKNVGLLVPGLQAGCKLGPSIYKWNCDQGRIEWGGGKGVIPTPELAAMTDGNTYT